MCKFFDESHYNQCQETMAMRVPDKEKANFCEYFSIKKIISATSDLQNEKEAQLNKLKKLFKDV